MALPDLRSYQLVRLRHELNGAGFESRRWQESLVFSKTFMGPSGFLFNEVRGSFPGTKRPGREGNHSSV